MGVLLAMSVHGLHEFISALQINRHYHHHHLLHCPSYYGYHLASDFDVPSATPTDEGF